MTTKSRRRRARRPSVGLWAACAAAAAMLVLGANGTLSSWTTAIITNTQNTVATSQAVILKEASGGISCASSDQPTTNSSTCATINKYGGTATPLVPGASQSVDVTFTNLGSAGASTFKLSPGTCSQTPTAGTGTPAAADLCGGGDLTISISCSPGSAFSAASAWTDLVYPAGVPPTSTKTHTSTGGDLNAGSSWTCRVTEALSASASVLDQGVTLSQPLTWTLTK